MPREPDSKPAASSPDRDASDPARPGINQQAIETIERLQGELDAMREQLTWSNRLSQLGTLAAMLAHETNNLITPVRSYAQLALSRPSDEKLTKRALEAAVGGTEKIQMLMERTLGLATPTPAGEAEGCIALDVANAAAEAVTPTLRRQRVRLNLQVQAQAVAIDALSLEQVLLNLIGNASRAMAEQEGGRDKPATIRISSRQAHGRLLLEISDTGPGIPETVQERLFEPFNRVDIKQTTISNTQSKSTCDSQGSGLGLSICKQLIEAAGGQIALTSSSSKGTTFEISLPLADEQTL